LACSSSKTLFFAFLLPYWLGLQFYLVASDGRTQFLGWVPLMLIFHNIPNQSLLCKTNALAHQY
jgi:hypothetical protein